MYMTPFETMQAFHKSAPDRKQTYKKMQKTFLASKVPMGLFTDGFTVIESDKKVLQPWYMKGYLDSGDINMWHDEERSLHMKARNLHYGTRLFGTWRNSAGVYKIDDAVAPQAMASLIPDETPSEIYANLPEWCVYMEFPDCYDNDIELNTRLDENNKDKIESADFKMLGFWAMHDRVIHEGKSRLCLDIFLHIGQEKGTDYRDLFVTPTRILIDPDLTVTESFSVGYSKGSLDFSDGTPFRTALTMLLWLCVEEPDVTNIKGVKMSRDDLKKPRYARNKQTGSFVPPQQEAHFEIAKRLGGEIREWDRQVADAEKSQHTSKRKAPHIRKGHWHGVWTGSANNKKFKLYWQQPLFINAK